jgi:hypothetical protein
MKNNWSAHLPTTDIDMRMGHFTTTLTNALTSKPTRTNLTPLKREIITTIKNNENVIIVSADKGHSPVGFDIEQNIEWGLQRRHDWTT